MIKLQSVLWTCGRKVGGGQVHKSHFHPAFDDINRQYSHIYLPAKQPLPGRYFPMQLK
jgi:hypothetical protein